MIAQLFKTLFGKPTKVAKAPKKPNINEFNHRLIYTFLYQILIRYLGVQYGFNAAQDKASDLLEGADYVYYVVNADGSVTYQIDESYIPMYDFTRETFIEHARLIFNQFRYNQIDPAMVEKMDVLYPISIEPLCNTIFNFHSKYSVDLVQNIETNMVLHPAVYYETEKGNDLDPNILFHTNSDLMCERTNNVVDRALNDATIYNDIEYVTLVYAGNVYTVSDRTAPLVPSLDYVITRSLYSQHKIGQDVGFDGLSEESYVELRNAKIKHASLAHEFCTQFIIDYLERHGKTIEEYRKSM